MYTWQIGIEAENCIPWLTSAPHYISATYTVEVIGHL